MSRKKPLPILENVTMTDVAAEGKGDENQGDLIAVAHGGQGILAYEFAGDKAVSQVVQLLEDDAAEKGQTEFPKNRFRAAYGQVLIHGTSPPASAPEGER